MSIETNQKKHRLPERFGKAVEYLKSNRAFSYTLLLLIVALFFLGVGIFHDVRNVLMEGAVQDGDAFKIEFHDKNLEREVRKLLEKPSGDIFNTDVETISVMTLQNVPVEDIEDLKYFTGLSQLTISSAKITDVSALSGMERLRVLDLSNNTISDVRPLAKIQTLQELTVSGNYITDMTPIYSLKNLIELDLSNNSITDVTPDITKLANLKTLNLSRNRIRDNSVFSGMKQLNILNLTSNKLTTASPLSGMDSLYEYSLEGNALTKITDLGGLPALEKLSVASNCLTDVSFAARYPWMIELSISLNNISSLEPLWKNTSLECLKMQYTKIEDVSVLKALGPTFNAIYVDAQFDRSKLDFMKGHFRNGDLLTKKYILGSKYGFPEKG